MSYLDRNPHSLKPKEILILRIIANSPEPMNKSQIERAKIGRIKVERIRIKQTRIERTQETLRLHHTEVPRHIEKLKRMHLIEVRHKELGKRPGSTSEFYDLTRDGLAWALCYGYTAIPNLYDTIFEKYNKLHPTIFKKWDYFKGKGLRNPTRTMLSLAARRYTHKMDEAQVAQALQMPDRMPITDLEAYFLLYLEPFDESKPGPEGALLSMKDREKLLDAIASDPELSLIRSKAAEKIVQYHATFPEYWGKRILETKEEREARLRLAHEYRPIESKPRIVTRP